MSDGNAEDVLRQAQAATQNTLGSYLTYWYVAHDLWDQVSKSVKENASNHLQFVPKHQGPMHTAGHAGSWLGKNKRRINKLKIVAHGKPGSFILGKEINYENVAPIGGWIYSFFDSSDNDKNPIEIVSCNAAADSGMTIGKCWVGQANSPKDKGLPHDGYLLLRNLAKASEQAVAGSLYGLSVVDLRLYWTCRRVKPSGAQEIFNALGGDPFDKGYCP